MRVSVVGSLTVASGAAELSGPALGGRRARVVLVALALAGVDVSANRLALLVWGEDLPPTWQTALRGIVLGLRKACATVAGSADVVETAASGYRLARDVEVDTDLAERDVLRAAELLAADRPQAALDLIAPVSLLSGPDLLPDVDAAWLSPRTASGSTALRSGRATSSWRPPPDSVSTAALSTLPEAPWRRGRSTKAPTGP